MREKFEIVYKLFRLNLYQQVFGTLNINHTDLSVSEYLYLESIFILDCPTVSEFANYFDISSSNATYKVTQLCKKGYLKKVHSNEDARVYRLVPTNKFIALYQNTENYIKDIFRHLEAYLDQTELKNLDAILDKILIKVCNEGENLK